MTRTIFVIDDDQDLRESIVEILAANGFEVVGCETAEAALRKLRIHQPVLAVLDNMMPGMGGMALIPLLKKERPQIKIIMITAFSTVDNAVTAMKSGADDYLAKPFKRNDLLVAVKRSFEEIRFEKQLQNPGIDDALVCLSNQIRRQILSTLAGCGSMRFMDLTRQLGISDHTKVNFHLKNLKANDLVTQTTEKAYCLTPQGVKMVDCLALLSKKISD